MIKNARWHQAWPIVIIHRTLMAKYQCNGYRKTINQHFRDIKWHAQSKGKTTVACQVL